MPPEPPHLDVRVTHRLGALSLDVSFQTAAPWTILFGPSGSGKSTLLRHIAGLARPDAGQIRVLGQPVADPGLWLRGDRRPIRWAGQRAALFPHRTVRQNIAAGLGSGAASSQLTHAALEAFGLLPLAGHHPDQLSGGQRQRVSVVRAAIGARGKLLLLDEPFAGLDIPIRDTLIASLRQWLGSQTPILSVTHDTAEAFHLNAEVIRLHEGRIVAQGPAATVLATERARLLATLAGPA